MPFLSHAGVSLRYDRAGSGPAVLFIHGWTCNRTFWERQSQALRDRHTVVTVDLRGHGESSRPRTGYSVGGLADDLEHLVRALSVPRVALVGWSLGGTVALELARRLGDRASALALVCTTPGGLLDPKSKTALDPKRVEETRAAIRQDARAFLRNFATDLFHEGARSPLTPWAAAQMQKTPPHVVELAFEGLLAFDGRKTLKDLKLPTAILHGRHDTLLPLTHAEALNNAIPDSELRVFEQSGHTPFLEETDAFNTALTALLAR